MDVANVGKEVTDGGDLGLERRGNLTAATKAYMNITVQHFVHFYFQQFLPLHQSAAILYVCKLTCLGDILEIGYICGLSEISCSKQATVHNGS